jgi:peptidoglycan/LPS O-acetylase OafA/YrhL
VFVKGLKLGLFDLSYWKATFLEVCVIGILLIAVFSSSNVPMGVRLGPYYTLPMATLILLLAVNRGAFSTVLRRAPLRILGEASFALYMLHGPIIEIFNNFRITLGLAAAPSWICGLLVALVSILASLVVHYFLERPAQTLLRRLLGSSQKSAQPEDEYRSSNSVNPESRSKPNRRQAA